MTEDEESLEDLFRMVMGLKPPMVNDEGGKFVCTFPMKALYPNDNKVMGMLGAIMKEAGVGTLCRMSFRPMVLPGINSRAKPNLLTMQFDDEKTAIAVLKTVKAHHGEPALRARQKALGISPHMLLDVSPNMGVAR